MNTLLTFPLIHDDVTCIHFMLFHECFKFVDDLRPYAHSPTCRRENKSVMEATYTAETKQK